MVAWVPLRVDWDRQPVSVHADEPEILERLVLYLRTHHMVKKRSLVMPDRDAGGFLFFIYQVCDPRWIISFLESDSGGAANG